MNFVRNTLWLLMRLCDPSRHGASEEYSRGWRDGVEAAAKSLGIDRSDFEQMNAISAFTEQGVPCHDLGLRSS
jgi:hypothetical protein